VIGVVLNLLEMMAEQDGPYKSRPACRTFARWVELGGGQVRGVALSGAATKAGAPPPPPADLMALDGSAVAGPREVPPLQLVDVRDPDLIDLLESVLRNLPGAPRRAPRAAARRSRAALATSPRARARAR
jgi:hypothetical protein